MNIQKDKQIDISKNTPVKKDFLKTVSYKTERIAAAMYLVTGFMLEEEPLKWALRKQAIELMNRASFSNDQEILSLIENLIRTCFLAKTSQSISDMNADIVIEELRSMNTFIQQRHTLPEDFFQESEMPSISKEIRIQAQDKQEDIKDKTPIAKMSFKKILTSPKLKKTSGRKDKRKEMVIEALQKKGDASIKDIARLVRGCSEKTIQRELNVLIDDGRVLKEGERRRSRYSLA